VGILSFLSANHIAKPLVRKIQPTSNDNNRGKWFLTSIYQFDLQENAFDSLLYNHLTSASSRALDARQTSGTLPQPQKILLFLLQLRQEICVGIELGKFHVYNKQPRRSSSHNNNKKTEKVNPKACLEETNEVEQFCYCLYRSECKVPHEEALKETQDSKGPSN